jgi:CheY-like chemotaxis protein
MEIAAYRILIIDDDEDARQSLQQDIARPNFNIDLAANTREAAVLLAKTVYHLVFSDKNMPNRDGEMDSDAGVQLLEQIQRDYPYTTCVLLTGHATARSFHRSQAAGLYQYLDKGLSKSELSGVVEQALEQRKVAVHRRGGLPEEVDVLFFWGQEGTVVKEIDRHSESPGCVLFPSGEWQAEPHPSGNVSRLKEGRTVKALHVERGRIEVIPFPAMY